MTPALPEHLILTRRPPPSPTHTPSYGPGPEHGGDHEHEALQSVQLAGSPLPLGPGSAAKAERAGLINVAASSSRQGW